MHAFALVVGVLTTLMVLLDAFETIVLPRTVRRSLRLTNAYYNLMTLLYAGTGRIRRQSLRQRILNVFAPLMVLGLIAAWAIFMIFGFALILWGSEAPLHTIGPTDGFLTPLYMSGVTFFTLGFGDVIPTNTLGRSLAVAEAGLGFGFLALIISYVPVMYASFSRREVQMLLLDARAGSEPTATELLRRHGQAGATHELTQLFKDWERFAAELLESYLSYPTLAYYRSQHDDQNWLHSLTAIMDACTLIDIGLDGDADWQRSLRFQARATFQMSRHVLVDLAYILDAAPIEPNPPRLTTEQMHAIYLVLDRSDVPLKRSEDAKAQLLAQRELYEPFVCGLAKALLMDIPDWISKDHVRDNWETTAWDGVKHF